MISKALMGAYLFHKEWGGSIVGESAVCALHAARAEAWAKDHLTFRWEWEDGFDWEPCREGEKPPEEWLCCVAYWRDEIEPWEALPSWNRGRKPWCCESLGGIGGPTREYRRVVESELAEQAHYTWLKNQEIEREAVAQAAQQTASFVGC